MKTAVRTPWATALPCLLCLGIAWQIVNKTLAAYLAEAQPRWASILAPGNLDAAVHLADRRLGQDPTRDIDDPERLAPRNSQEARARIVQRVDAGVTFPIVAPDLGAADAEAIRRSIEEAWPSSPLDPRAPRLLGQLAETTDASRAFMRQARRLSMHETLAIYWLFQDAFLRADLRAAVSFADILLRAHPELAPYVVPVLLRAAAEPEGAVALKTALESHPPWRPYFFRAICPGLANLSLPMDLLSDLLAGAEPPTQWEVTAYLDCLVGHELFSLARWTWLRLLHGGSEAPAPLLWDGNFEARSFGTIFDWNLRADGGAAVEYSDAPGKPGRSAIKIDFREQFIDALAVSQIVTLGPGDYVLTGEEAGVFNAKHGLIWTSACVSPPSVPFAHSQRLFGSKDGWKDFSFAFTVPAENCPAQVLTLGIDAVSNSERIVTGSAWFTNLALKPRS